MYIRISLEDDDLQNGKAESNSITNQRELISTFILGKDEFSVCRIKEFFDDGFTGRNFDRPGFQGMIIECRAGNIKCIVVKDLSHLGRNYVEVGNLLEQLFPFLGVRVISINDNYDSDAFNGQTGGIDAGHMVSHKKEYESFDSKHQIAVDKSDWIIIRNTHEAIVTQEEFDRANANMRYVRRGKKDNPANKKNFSVIICPHCGLTLRPGNKKDIYMYCPTGRNHNDSPCQNVRIKKDVVESTLVKLVRNQAEMLVTAEKILKQKKEKCSGQNQPEVIIKRLQAEMKKLESSKIADYESYKAGKMEREAFTEKKALIDTRKQEILSAIDEMEAKLLVEDEEQRQYQDAFEIKKYIHLEKYDKAVMAALILKAEVVDENRLNVVWKHQDIYEKIFSIL